MHSKKQYYPFEMKKKVVELYFEGHSATDLAKRFDLTSRKRVTDWVSKVRKAGTMDALNDTRGLSNKGITRKKKESMLEENERLKLEILYLKKLIDLKRE